MSEYSVQVVYNDTTTLPKRKEQAIIGAINDYEFGGLTQDEVAAKYNVTSKTLRAWIKKYYNSRLNAVVFGELPKAEVKAEDIPVRPVKAVDPFCAAVGTVKELMSKDIF